MLGALAACKTSPDAINAAAQITNLSQRLVAYYTDLSNQQSDTVALNEMYNQLMFQTPLNQQVRDKSNETVEELAKRVALAKALSSLASAYSALAGSNAATDVSTAAANLATQCAALKPLPGGPAISNVVATATQQLVEYMRQRKLHQSSGVISDIMSGMDRLFRQEMPEYLAINKRHVNQNLTVALALLDRGVVEVSPLLQPTLKPFDLATKPISGQLQPDMRGLVEAQLNAKASDQISDFAATTTGLAFSLEAAQKQVALVAGEHSRIF